MEGKGERGRLVVEIVGMSSQMYPNICNVGEIRISVL